jgi:hypothetical protein
LTSAAELAVTLAVHPFASVLAVQTNSAPAEDPAASTLPTLADVLKQLEHLPLPAYVAGPPKAQQQSGLLLSLVFCFIPLFFNTFCV